VAAGDDHLAGLQPVARAGGAARWRRLSVRGGRRCIAAGIRDDSGDLVAGLSISAPADFLQNGWVEQLCRTAAQISASLGYDVHELQDLHH